MDATQRGSAASTDAFNAHGDPPEDAGAKALAELAAALDLDAEQLRGFGGGAPAASNPRKPGSARTSTRRTISS